MGYLTTFTVYNDGLHIIEERPKEFGEKLYKSTRKSLNSTTEFGLGCFANIARVQQSRHADDHTIYVHMGNCLTEVNIFSEEFKRLIKTHPEFAKKLVNFLDSETKLIKNHLKKIK